ncbi:hypothetical protein [Sphingomonas hankookensis]|uniref:hypothetical protein n=1 Tax=Sphingomonas hankookensis TaxID=563996 RepID=UPI003D302C88
MCCGGIAPRGLGTDADRRGVEPYQPLRHRQLGEGGGAAHLGEAGQVGGLRQIGGFAQQRQQLRQFDLGRPLGGVQFGPGDGVERARLHRVEPELRISPSPAADRGEHLCIGVAIFGR